MPQHCSQHVPIGDEGFLGEGVRTPRWLRPVLPHLVVHVRWRSYAGTGGENSLQRPSVGTVRVHTDRQIGRDPQPHPGGERNLS